MKVLSADISDSTRDMNYHQVRNKSPSLILVRNHTRSLSAVLSPPHHLHPIIDADGNLDVIVPVCDPFPSCSSTNGILIAFNQQMGVCSAFGSSSSVSCRPHSDLCRGDLRFSFPGVHSYRPADTDVKILVDFPANDRVVNPLSSFVTPFTVRVGDLNLDGFPDLLVTGTATTRILLNMECSAVCFLSLSLSFIHSPLSHSIFFFFCSSSSSVFSCGTLL